MELTPRNTTPLDSSDWTLTPPDPFTDSACAGLIWATSRDPESTPLTRDSSEATGTRLIASSLAGSPQ